MGKLSYTQVTCKSKQGMYVLCSQDHLIACMGYTSTYGKNTRQDTSPIYSQSNKTLVCLRKKSWTLGTDKWA